MAAKFVPLSPGPGLVSTRQFRCVGGVDARANYNIWQEIDYSFLERNEKYLAKLVIQMTVKC